MLIKSVTPRRQVCNPPHDLIIHEVHYNLGPYNLGERLFVELQMRPGPDAPEDSVNLKHYGLLVIEHNRHESRMEDAFYVREAFDLSDIHWPLTGKL